MRHRPNGWRRAGFVVSDGGGTVTRVDEDLAATARTSFPGCRWDNHLLTLRR